jgi:hypothetical protein
LLKDALHALQLQAAAHMVAGWSQAFSGLQEGGIVTGYALITVSQPLFATAATASVAVYWYWLYIVASSTALAHLQFSGHAVRAMPMLQM